MTKAAARSKQRMREGKEPECLLDFWSQQVLIEIAEADEQGIPHPFYSADDKMADSVMDFLFASQVGGREGSRGANVQTTTQIARRRTCLSERVLRMHSLRLISPPSDPRLSVDVL